MLLQCCTEYPGKYVFVQISTYPIGKTVRVKGKSLLLFLNLNTVKLLFPKDAKIYKHTNSV